MSYDPNRLRRLLILHEGYKVVPYVDTVGMVTAGIGHNINAHPLPPELIDTWYREDVEEALELLDESLPWWRGLDDIRQLVMIDMAFNLGKRLLTFENTLRMIKAGEWGQASVGMLSSKWAKQVGGRAKRLATMMRTGEWGL